MALPGERIVNLRILDGWDREVKEGFCDELEILELHDWTSMCLLDLQDFIRLSFDFDALRAHFKLFPDSIDKILSLIFIELFLPEVGGVDARCSETPCHVVVTADSNAWYPW